MIARLLALMLVMAPQAALACATCFGDPNSLQTKAVNQSILFLLGVIVTVLVLFAGTFLYWMYRHNKYNQLGTHGVAH